MNRKLKQEIEALFRELHKGYPEGRTVHKLVTKAGVPEQLSDQDVPTAQILIKALRTNTGYIEVGFDGTTTIIGRGHELEAKDNVVIPIDNLNKVWIDSTVDGEGVSLLLVV